MKNFLRPALMLAICLSIALLNAGLTHSPQPVMQGAPSATPFLLQTTLTPQPEGVSEIGSTDGIIAMGGIIVLIIIIPILLRRKHWVRSAQQ